MKQRILFTASTGSHILHFHRPYLQAFRDLGWEVHVACGGTLPALPEADRIFLLPFEKKMSSPANFRAQAQLRALMKAHDYTLISTHTSLAAFFTRRAAAGLHPRPAVVNVAHGYLFDDTTPLLKRQILLSAERLTSRQTDLLLTMNAFDFELARRCHLGQRVEQIPGIGVDFTRLESAAPPMPRATYHFSSSDFILLYAAEFSTRKNQAMLIRAMPALPEHVKLLLPGEGILLDACRTLASTLGVAHRVVFPGQISDMAPLYDMADAAVTASRSEGLPFNVMEAMYKGLPVIASQVKGHTDLLSNGSTGLLYPYDDEAAFCEALQHLLTQPELAPRLGAAAHKAVLPFSLDQVLPQVMERYLSLAPQPAEPLPVSR